MGGKGHHKGSCRGGRDNWRGRDAILAVQATASGLAGTLICSSKDARVGIARVTALKTFKTVAHLLI